MHKGGVPPAHMGKSENNPQELVLSYHHMEPGDHSQDVMLVGKYLHLLSHTPAL